MNEPKWVNPVKKKLEAGQPVLATTITVNSVDVAAHAYLNTVMSPFFGEACATCHGDGKDHDVVKVHAR